MLRACTAYGSLLGDVTRMYVNENKPCTENKIAAFSTEKTKVKRVPSIVREIANRPSR